MGVKTQTKKDDFPDMRKIAKGVDGITIHCGVLGEQAYYAAIHEYGCKIEVTPKMRKYLASQGLHLKASTKYITIPERSFLRTGYDENIDEIMEKADKLKPDVLSGKMTPRQFADAVGLLLKSAIQNYANDLDTPKNHPFTVKQKGSSNPLVDSGDMIGAIDYEVVK